MRLKYIDSAKGLAMLLIVWGHTVTFSDPVSQWASAFKISLFYIVTGLLLGFRAKDGVARKTSVMKLLLSMGVPYVFYSLLSLGAAMVMMLIEKRDFDFIIDKIILTVTLNGVSTLWFLPSIFFGRLLFERLMCRKVAMALKVVSAVVLPVLLVISAEYISVSGLNKVVQSLLLVILKVFVAFWFIGVGFEIGQRMNAKESSETKGFLTALVFLICGSITAFFNRGVDLNNGIFGSRPLLFFLSGVLCSLGIIGVFAFVCERKPCRITEFTGKNSLFIMVTHLPLYIVPIVSMVISAFVKAEGIAFDYFRAVIAFVLVLGIEWVLISVKIRVTAKVKSEKISELFKYI